MQIGSIVAYTVSGKASIGLINDMKGKKVILKNSEGKRESIAKDKINFIIEDSNKNLSENELKTKYSELVVDADKIDIAEIYEVLEGEADEIGLSDIAELYFADGYNKHKLFSLYHALLNDNIYFKWKNENFVPKKRSDVEERLRQIAILKEKEEQEKQMKAEAVEWLKNYFKEYYENNDGDNETNTSEYLEIPESVSNYIKPVREYAIHGDRMEKKSSAIEVLKKIRTVTAFKMVSSQYESAIKLMQELGIFDEDENLSILKYSIPTSFKDEIIELAEEIDEFRYDPEAQPSRLDYRHQNIFTIDDQNTTDIDDGLSIEETETGYRLYIHIADVSYYVKKDSILDKEALQRSTTVYLPIGKISMFPERLSENLMSLVEGKERPAITFSVEFDHELNRIPDTERVNISAIKVKKRLSFIEAEGLIIDEEGEENTEDRQILHRDLNLMLDIAENLRLERIDNGAVDFNTPSIKVMVDENKNITVKKIEANLKSNLLVKEAMVLANNIASEFCIKNDIPCLFITQPQPDEPVDIDYTKNISRTEIYKIIRKMKKSEMGITPGKHAGLGVNAYTQATSPIRRYNDLLVHRQLKSYIRTKKDQTVGEDGEILYDTEEIQIVAATAERTARETMNIERESRRYWLLKYLSNMIDEMSTALVIRKLNINYKVMLDNTLTSAILVTNEDIEPGYLVDVRIQSVKPRSDNVTVTLA